MLPKHLTSISHLSRLSRLLDGILVILLLAFIAVFLANCFLARGGDHPVFWEAGRNYLTAQPLYDLARDGAQSYKYPPWISPLFIPFSIPNMEVSGVAWRILQLLCMLYSLNWCAKRCQKPVLAIIPFIMLWGSWMFNLIQGQITPLLLAFSLAGFSKLKEEKGKKTAGLGTILIVMALSAKLFNLAALLGLDRRFWNKQRVLIILILMIAATLPALPGYSGASPLALAHSYLKTSGSLTQNLGGAGYGLPNLWIYWLSLTPDAVSSRITGFGISAALMGLLLFKAQKVVSQTSLFAIAIALAASIHPLAFTYSFVWAFPLMVFALNRAFHSAGETKKLILQRLMMIIGLCGVTFFDQLGISLPGGIPARALSIWILALTLLIEPDKKDTRPKAIQEAR